MAFGFPEFYGNNMNAWIDWMTNIDDKEAGMTKFWINTADTLIIELTNSEVLKKNSFGILKATPYGNTITKDLAIACLKNEKLGKDEFADILAISFSSPDIIAHSYGPRSVEMEDVYLRLDLDIAELIKTLDAEVGANNYVIFLTADHGGADVAAHLNDEKIPADLFK